MLNKNFMVLLFIFLILILSEPVNSKKLNLHEKTKATDSIVDIDLFITTFKDSDDPALVIRVAEAMINKGRFLLMLDRNNDALATFEKVIADYGETDASGLQEKVAHALLLKGSSL